MKKVLLLFLIVSLETSAQEYPEEKRIIISSDGWELIGDLSQPNVSKAPFVIMLNQAAGDRSAYAAMVPELNKRGIGTLRIDLRGHGESINLGKFEPAPGSDLIYDAEKDVKAILEFISNYPGVDSSRIGIVGASYSGEEAAEAGRNRGFVKAYVLLSPGSFSDESILSMDNSGADWLFVIAREDQYLKEIRANIELNSQIAEIYLITGSDHATSILIARPELNLIIAYWLKSHL